MTSHAQSERRQLAELFDRVGPEAPTLCEGWQTADLAAHLVMRERRPDAAPGLVVPGLAPYAQRVQQSIRDRQPWSALVNLVRQGPPWPWRLVDESVNTGEYFVHHEDVRRAQPQWTARTLDPGLERSLWDRLSSPFGRLLVRRAPPGVTLQAPGFGTARIKAGPEEVTVSGSPGELTLFLFGRGESAQVTLSGNDLAVARLRQARLGL